MLPDILDVARISPMLLIVVVVAVDTSPTCKLCIELV